jgi:spermidine synthase
VRVDRRGGALELRVDGSLASRYVPGRASTGLVWDALASALVWLPPARRRSVLVLGLGGGSAARVARALAPNAHIVGVELDAGVLRAAQRWLGLDALGVEVVQGDARAFLEHGAERYDAILEDVFVGRGRAVHKPEWLPRPGLELARGRLRRGGVLASNTLDESAEVERALRELLPATVRIEVEEYDNRILVGGPAGLTGRGLRERARAEPLLEETFPRLAFRTR